MIRPHRAGRSLRPPPGWFGRMRCFAPISLDPAALRRGAVRAAAVGRIVHVGRELRGQAVPWMPWTLSLAVSCAVGFGLTT
jgi:hypothetical protein